MSTIYVQYINGNPKISINIKANHYSLKNLTNRLTKKLIDERKMFGGAFCHASQRERIKNKQ